MLHTVVNQTAAGKVIFVYLELEGGQIQKGLCLNHPVIRTCSMKKWSSIKTKVVLERPRKRTKCKHFQWILMPSYPISGKWGVTRLIHNIIYKFIKK